MFCRESDPGTKEESLVLVGFLGDPGQAQTEER
jgi:hypothetical protein